MKIVIYLYYFFRSAGLRGLVNTVRLLRSELSHEKRFGISTARIKKSESSEYFHYQGASYLVLLRIFSGMPEYTRAFNFTDIGCGKGRAVFVAEYCGFRHLRGIELDAELVAEAQKNIAHYAFRSRRSDITFIHANALEYEYRNEPGVYFLFNPFSETVLRDVLKKIKKTVAAETWFIYMNPMYPAPFRESGLEQVQELKTRFYTEALIFRMNPGKTGDQTSS